MISLGRRTTELGALPQPNGSTRFLVWAPKFESVELHLIAPRDQVVPMNRLDRGYWAVTAEDVPVGSRYFFRYDGTHDWPDPASRSQPDGVHGASEVIDLGSFNWKLDVWRAPALEDYVIYEAHIGTFTPEGTFASAIEQLDHLRRLGVTALEIMPIAQFPGDRNWGYDGVFPFAAQSTYGGAEGLVRLVDACHERGLAVILDVVYNHFGPEGAYIAATGNYLTGKYHTPWGAAINFDGPGSDEVRRFFIESALYWLRDLRIDGFRLDAVHAIYDQSAYPFLRQFAREIHAAARELGRTACLIAESDLNDPRLIQSPVIGGYGFDAQWCDDLHHAVHAVLTGETTGYYTDFGSCREIKEALGRGFVNAGQYSRHRQRAHGALPESVEPSQFIVFSQNHDQIGNRAMGDRLTATLEFEQLKLAAATVILSPFTPMLFMGEEYGETAPYQYFVSHGDSDLVEAVRKGRVEEFSSFGWSEELPDPQDLATFERSKLSHSRRSAEPGNTLEAFYRDLIRLRRELPAFRQSHFLSIEVEMTGRDGPVILMRRWNADDEAAVLFNYSADQQEATVSPGNWSIILDSADKRWGGPGSRTSANQHIDSSGFIAIAGWSAVLLGSTPRTSG